MTFKHGHAPWKKRPSAEYVAWQNMLKRCHNKKDRAFKWYGARGIAVCDRWRKSFVNFLADMGLKPSPKHTLERADNDKGYSPDNCVWRTQKEQTHNTRRNAYVTVDGERMILIEACRKYGVSHATARRRLNKGLSAEDAFARVDLRKLPRPRDKNGRLLKIA